MSCEPPQALSLPQCGRSLQEASSIVIMLGNLMAPPPLHQALRRSQEQQQLTMASALTKGQANGSKTEKKHTLMAGKFPTTKLFPYSACPQKSEGSGPCLSWPKALWGSMPGIWRLALAVLQVSRVALPWMPTERPHWTHHQKSFPPSPVQFKGNC